MAGHGSKLPRKFEQALAALLSESSVARAAAKVGVSEKTLRNWLKQPDFVAAYRDAQKDLVEAGSVVLKKFNVRAATTLAKNLTCGKPAAEIHAAKVLLEMTMKLTDHLDLAERVAALEQAEQARKRRQRHQ